MCVIKEEFTDDSNILVKNIRPVVPPGTSDKRNDNIAINCKTAQSTVNGVDCKWSAQYNVPINVTK
ncbi:hypothetical protein V1478_001852 [Vespula squamosa]|uniref:Uncharacterized protein n=1 Tax=Vespula squamosa TaxID=30214 RepID=A0ABD2BYA5_VESSQ